MARSTTCARVAGPLLGSAKGDSMQRPKSGWKDLRHSLIALAGASVLLATASTAHAQTWTLAWSDEFNGSGAVDPTNWTYDVGGGGWGNAELEYYQSGALNASQAGGLLTIQARS